MFDDKIMYGGAGLVAGVVLGVAGAIFAPKGAKKIKIALGNKKAAENTENNAGDKDNNTENNDKKQNN